MFNTLSDKLSNALSKLKGTGRLTDDNIKSTLKEIRRTLLEADVALTVTQDFIKNIQAQAVGKKIQSSIKPGDALVKLVKDELVHILGGESQGLNLKAQAPIVILMSGLQGSGKTTTVAKLASQLSTNDKKKVLVASADVYRPAAIDQLETLAQQVNVECYPSSTSDKPLKIAENALLHAKKHHFDILILDTAGRNHIDDELMTELEQISHSVSPTETLLVVDSMTGQDAVNVAKTFNDRLALSGIVLTKTDGDSRGGAALSMRMITGKPIKFMGTGEKVDAFEVFHPDRVASRILGMGDIISLVEEAERKVDKKEADKLAKKLKKGKRFDFNDFLSQLQQMKKMGGMQSMLTKLPGMGKLPPAAKAMMDDGLFKKMEAIINSMTAKERQFPALINGSRKKRIALGSGNEIPDVNKLLKQFAQMQKMLKRMKGDKMMKRLKNIQGKLPPELLSQLPDDFK